MFGAEAFNVERWRHFRSVDLYDELCHWLKNGRLDIASCLCGRFADVLSEKLVCCLDATLALIPDEVVTSDLCAWLTHAVLPPVLESQDFHLIDSLAGWIEKRASDMEVTQRQSWPMNAIQLCDVLRTDACGTLWKNVTPKAYACRTVGLALPQTGLDEARQSQNALVRVRVLCGDLQQIIELRDRYNCLLSLAELRAETVESVAYRFLDRVVAVQLIPAAMSDIVRPYATRYCLKLDDLLSSYIQELVHRRGTGSMHVSALWESKAIEILNNISSRALSEQSLLAILSAAQFPWSDDVSNAVKKALMRNPSHAGLKGQCQLASLKQILIGYDLQRFNFAETMQAKQLAYYILMQDKETAVADALAVADVYSNVSCCDVYQFRCCFLAERNRADEIVDLLNGITVPALLDEVCERFVQYCGNVLSNPLRTFHCQYATAARHVRRLLTKLSCECSQDIREQLSDLEAVYRLHSEFGKFMSVSDYCTPSKRHNFYKECLNDTSAKSADKRSLSNLTEPRALASKRSRRELARLLKMSCYDEVFEAVQAARHGNVHSAVELTQRIVKRKCENTVELVRQVLSVVKALCESIENGCVVSLSELVDIHQLSCNLVLTAPANMLDQCLNVCRSLRLAVELAQQCCTDNSSVSLEHSVDSGHQQWTFDDYLSDDDCAALIMDMHSAVSLALAFVSATLPTGRYVCQSPIVMTQQMVDIAEKLSQLLTANNQTRLLLGYLLEVATLVGGVLGSNELHSAVLVTLKQSLSRRRADYQLALTAVCSLPQSLAQDNLHKLARSAGIQYKKALAIARVGLMFAQLTCNTDAVPVAENLVTEAQWGYRFAKVHVSYRECFGRGTDDKILLIPELAANKSISVDDVVAYCKDFRLDINDSLCLYLTCLLVPSSDSPSVVSVTPFSVVQQRAHQACCHIKPESLVNTLEKIFDKTSAYDYDRLEFILDQLLVTSRLAKQLNRSVELSTIERDRKLIDCLKCYQRVSPLNDDELISDDAVKDRLPFHMLTRKKLNWNIITPELNADTVQLWIAMAALLDIPADYVYTTAIRNIVQSHTKQLTSEPQWSETSINTDFMDTVHRLLSQVTSSDLAMACVSWVAHELPAGAEKVQAYAWCVSVQERHVASCSYEQKPRAMEVLERLRFRSRQTSIEQVGFYTVNQKKHTTMFFSYLPQNPVDSDKMWYALT